MNPVYYQKRVEGVAIPAIIHNSSYFLIQMAVYEDGTVSCWHKSDLAQFLTDLRKGWVVPSMPAGKLLSVYGLGGFTVQQARWQYNMSEYYRHVKQIVQKLNPEMQNLYCTTQREIDKREAARVRLSASPAFCKMTSKLGYRLADGESGYIFYRGKGRLCLTPLTGYADRTFRIDAAGDTFFSLEEILALFQKEILCTAPEKDEWVEIDGLGQILLDKPGPRGVSAQEKQKEMADMADRLSGEKDTLDRCRQAHYAYLVDPCEWNREALKKAYEAVPKHQRIYLGDMDTRDSDIVRILNCPNEKREV